MLIVFLLYWLSILSVSCNLLCNSYFDLILDTPFGELLLYIENKSKQLDLAPIVLAQDVAELTG